MSQPSRMLVAGDIKQKLRRIFFWTPCRDLLYWVFDYDGIRTESQRAGTWYQTGLDWKGQGWKGKEWTGRNGLERIDLKGNGLERIDSKGIGLKEFYCKGFD